jgi:hypothetical protein
MDNYGSSSFFIPRDFASSAAPTEDSYNAATFEGRLVFVVDVHTACLQVHQAQQAQQEQAEFADKQRIDNLQA